MGGGGEEETAVLVEGIKGRLKEIENQTRHGILSLIGLKVLSVRVLQGGSQSHRPNISMPNKIAPMC